MKIKLNHKQEPTELTKEQKETMELIESEAKKAFDFRNLITNILEHFDGHKLKTSPKTVFISYTDPTLELTTNQIFLSDSLVGEDFYIIDVE